MNAFHLYSKHSGVDFGIFAGETERDALDAMNREAGAPGAVDADGKPLAPTLQDIDFADVKHAHAIMANCPDVPDATAAAEEQAIAKDQLRWGADTYTVYVFDDNSMLAQSGPHQLAVDAGEEKEVDDYVRFLGDAAEADAQRIADMRAALA